MKKIAIITTHPIQYNAPLFRLISNENDINIHVFYTWEQSKEKLYDEKFGREIKWDIPLLEGYDYTFVKNIAKKPSSAKFNGIINPDLINEIENWNANAILVYGWNHQSHFKAMRYFKNKIPVYFRGDSTIIDENKSLKTVLRRIWLKFVYQFIDIAFYVGTNNKAYYLKHGLKKGQLFFAPHAIDNERFYDKNDDYTNKAKQWRNKLKYKDNDIVILFVGKFESKKNPLLMVSLAKKLTNYHFLFIGNGELESKLKEEAQSLPNIKFIGFQNQSVMPIVYRLGNIFILPSKGPNETWGLSINEAMACGLPIIASDKVGCAIDLVKNNGYIFESGNLDDLYDKVKKISSIKQLSDNSLTKIKSWNYLEFIKVLTHL